MKEVVLGFLGGGNIGGCVYRLLEDMRQEIAHRCGVTLRVKTVLVKDLASFVPNGIPEEKLVVDKAAIMNDPEITLVAEFMGGEHPAADFMLEALQAGKTVVTANKVALATHWHELQQEAEKQRVGLYYEASVGGAIPIIATLQHSMQANRIDRMMGIINGTTNYILSRMDKDGADYAQVLRDAQQLGLAEPNPTFDVEGMDTAFKLSILASLAFHGRVTYEKVHREGITKVTAQDIAFGRELGYALKLLAIAKRDDEKVEVRVHPTFIPKEHPLAQVDGSYNAVYLHGHSCEDLMLQGYGAGTPTASAVVSDILNAVTTDKHYYDNFENTAEATADLHFTGNWESRYYIRLSVADTVGMLSKVADCFARECVSIANMMQKEARQDGSATMIFITHAAKERAVQMALTHLDPAFMKVENVIRVEE